MKPLRANKQTKPLPNRGAMQELASSPRSLADYSKQTPLDVARPTPNVLQNLRVKR